MIEISKYTLSNGLRLVHHRDTEAKMIAMNIVYDVGSRDEVPGHTGFAHLFEHLMFGGSVNIPEFDSPLQLAGGENNAWTNNDITNYYIVIPKQNIETAFWLESDRMLSLAFSEKSLEVQRQVVMEEFKQRNINQPYGDVGHLIRPMVYKVHPYRHPVIGEDLSHIQNATLDDVKQFFFSHYAPNNAILSIVGDISLDETIRLAEKWFGPIERRTIAPRQLPMEQKQELPRKLSVTRDVPQNMIVKAYHMCDRMSPDYQAIDLVSDVLSNGKSSRLYRNLVIKNNIFSTIDASITGDSDPGMFIIKAKLNNGISYEQAEEAILKEINEIKENVIPDIELQKTINIFESFQVYNNIHYLNKATNLAYYELISSAEDINKELNKYRAITVQDIHRVSQRMFDENNCSTLYYSAEHNV